MNSPERFWVLGQSTLETRALKATLELAGERWEQPRAEGAEQRFTPADLGLEVVEKAGPAKRGGIPYDPPREDRWTELASKVLVLFVSCEPAAFPKRSNTMLFGKKKGRPPVLLQVEAFLRMEGMVRLSAATMRWFELVAAHSAGGMSAVKALGASALEILSLQVAQRDDQQASSAAT